MVTVVSRLELSDLREKSNFPELSLQCSMCLFTNYKHIIIIFDILIIICHLKFKFLRRNDYVIPNSNWDISYITFLSHKFMVSKNSKLGKDLTARFIMYHKKGIETFGYSNKFPIKILALHKEGNMPTFWYLHTVPPDIVRK